MTPVAARITTRPHTWGWRTIRLLLACAGPCGLPVAAPGQVAAEADATSAEAPVGCGSLVADADPARQASRALVAGGFANVAAVADSACLLATYENARFRDDRRALREAARLLTPLLHPGQRLVLLPAFRGIPILRVHVPAPPTDSGQAADTDPANPRADASLEVADAWRALSGVARASGSAGRVDVVVHPWFQAIFGAYDNPVASRTGVAPELRMDVRPGLRLSAQLLVTLQDDVPTGESRLRPGQVTVNQVVRLPRNVFVSATAGVFNPDRYGADVEGRAFLAGGRVTAGAELGVTGAASYARGGWERTPVRDRTALLDVGWRVVPYDLLLRATAGVFLEDERGVRVDVARRFGELEIGWFLVASDVGENGGFVLRIPLVPRTYGGPAPLRVRAAESYRWQYRYRGFVPGGARYTTGSGLMDAFPLLNPAAVRQAGPFIGSGHR
jgi:hypothetical protein